MEEANHLATYESEVYVIHQWNTFQASKITQNIVRENPKIRVVWNSEVVEAYGDRSGSLAGVIVKNVVTGLVWDLKVSGLFLAVGHDPATEFLGGQLKLDVDGYVATKLYFNVVNNYIKSYICINFETLNSVSCPQLLELAILKTKMQLPRA